jgi:hypothetical protein
MSLPSKMPLVPPGQRSWISLQDLIDSLPEHEQRAIERRVQKMLQKLALAERKPYLS